MYLFCFTYIYFTLYFFCFYQLPPPIRSKATFNKKKEPQSKTPKAKRPSTIPSHFTA